MSQIDTLVGVLFGAPVVGLLSTYVDRRFLRADKRAETSGKAAELAAQAPAMAVAANDAAVLTLQRALKVVEEQRDEAMAREAAAWDQVERMRTRMDTAERTVDDLRLELASMRRDYEAGQRQRQRES